MIKKALFLIIVLGIIGGILYIFTQNDTLTTVKLNDQYILKDIKSGLVLIGSFVAGLIIASIFSLYFSLKSFIKVKKLGFKEKKTLSFFDGMVKARNELSSGLYPKAQDSWKKLISKDPTEIISRVELSKSLEGEDKLRDALKVLDEARSKDPSNTDVLYRAYELNLALKNKTAAIDNLALIQYHTPSAKASRLARDLSEDLQRFDDALEYQEKLESLGDNKDSYVAKARINFKKLLKQIADNEEIENDEKLSLLKKFAKKNSKYPTAIAKYAKTLHETKKPDQAVEMFMKAYKVNKEAKYWHEAVSILIENDQAEKALNLSKMVLKETKGKDRLKSELDYIRILSNLDMHQEALDKISKFYELSEREEINPSIAIKEELNILKALVYTKHGDYTNAVKVLNKSARSSLI